MAASTDAVQAAGLMSFGRKTRDQLNILKRLVDFLPIEDDKILLASILREIDEISVKRNKIVHSLWGTFNGEPARYHRDLTFSKIEEIMYETDKGKSLRGSSIFTVADLKQLTEQTVRLRDALIQALHHINPEPGPQTRHDIAKEDEWEARRQERNAIFAQQSGSPPNRGG